MGFLWTDNISSLSPQKLFIDLCSCVFFRSLEDILDEARAVYISNILSCLPICQCDALITSQVSTIFINYDNGNLTLSVINDVAVHKIIFQMETPFASFKSFLNDLKDTGTQVNYSTFIFTAADVVIGSPVKINVAKW